ncbi:FH protein interacting protein FIP2 [Tanacetum coccineum]
MKTYKEPTLIKIYEDDLLIIARDKTNKRNAEDHENDEHIIGRTKWFFYKLVTKKRKVFPKRHYFQNPGHKIGKCVEYFHDRKIAKIEIVQEQYQESGRRRSMQLKSLKELTPAGFTGRKMSLNKMPKSNKYEIWRPNSLIPKVTVNLMLSSIHETESTFPVVELLLRKIQVKARKGDYYKYLAEFKSSNDKKEVADQSLRPYQDLSYVDFSFACLKNVFFSRANLHCAKFRDVDAENTIFQNATLHEEDVNACLIDCSLCGADLCSAHLQTSDLTNANLEGANLKATCLYLKMLFECEVFTLKLSLSMEEPEESEFAGRKEMTVLPYCGYPAGYCGQV